MKLPNFSKLFRRSKMRPFLVLDIGTVEVKAAIFLPQKEGRLKVLGAARQVHGHTSFHGCLITHMDAVIESCSLAIEQASLQAGVSPRETILLSAGKIRSVQTKVRLARRDEASLLTERELDKIFEKVKEKIEPEVYKKAAAIYGVDASQLYHLGERALEYQLDGKKMDSPVGFTGKELKISLLDLFCLQKEFKVLTRLSQVLDLEMVGFQSPTMAAASLLREKFGRGIVVDLGGKITEVAVFKEGAMSGGGCVNWGGYHLTWRLMRRFDLGYDQAERLKLSAGSGGLDEDKQRQIDLEFIGWREILLAGIEEVLRRMLEAEGSVVAGSLPETMFIIGGGAKTANLKSAFIAYPWTKRLSFGTFPKPQFVSLLDLVDLEGKADKLKEPNFLPLVGAAMRQI
ncbi:hypothetical protein B5M47_01975 [candidate division CPR3 bacterium 4484_211]|uniref:SHS2 domain-containing protein n=1 Tax=candidate division CPR3 bacterium 4484_211 TaxID=1968527 RepID=A0A1W9NYC9_UNCC3|nr:MAG: hypothetical protein B5M47_01975 [candidate division CPR3 bacterium 4484_211]